MKSDCKCNNDYNEYKGICDCSLTLKKIAKRTCELGADFKLIEEEDDPLFNKFSLIYIDEKDKKSELIFLNNLDGKREAMEYLDKLEEILDVLEFLDEDEDEDEDEDDEKICDYTIDAEEMLEGWTDTE